MEVIVRPYDWVSGDQDGGYSIRIWGHMKDTPEAYAKEVLIRVEDYLPWCRIELPTVVEGKPVAWNEPALRAYSSWLRFVLNEHEPKKILYKPMEKLYGFKNRMKFPFLICHFETEEAMRHCTNLLGKQAYNVKQLGLIKAKVWETSITTIHRLVTEIKVGYGQWFKAKGEKVPEMDRISYLEEEYIVPYKEIVPLDEESTKSWSVSPLIAAIDIECYSHNHRAMPNRDYADDVVFQISFILQRLGQAKTRKKYLLVVGPCDPIPGAEVIHYQDEIALIDGLSDMIRKTDPSILLGYNIFGFDFPYLDARLKLRLRDWKPCSRMKDGQTLVNKKEWKSSAYGFMTIAPLEAEGRICIDMYPIIRRDYKLDRYTLDFVAKNFLDRGKHDVSAKQMFEIYAECCAAEAGQDEVRLSKASQEMAKVGAYCLEDSCLCIDLMEKLNTWIMLTELASIVAVKILHIFTQGQQLRVQNEVYQECWEEFVIDERPGSAEGFKGGKVQDPLPGKYRNILIFDFASLYPSIIRAFNICYTTLVPPESNLPDEMCHVLEWSEVDDTKKSPTFGQTKHYRFRFIKKEYFHGVLPRMCEKLVQARSATRKLINPKNDPVYNIVLNQRQNGLKVTANSIFGSLGVSEGRLPLPEGASSVTAMGRVLIGQAANYVREKYKGRIVYGDTDSVMVDLELTDPHDCLHMGEQLSKEITAIFPKPLSLEFERALAIGFFIKKKKYAGVPMAIIRLIDGDLIERVPFDPLYEEETMNLYRFTLLRDGKKKVSYVAIPKNSEICSAPLEIGTKIQIVWPKEKEKDNPVYLIDQKEFTGRKVVAGTPLLAGGKPNPDDLMKKGVVLARRDNCIWLREIYMKALLSIMFDKPLEQTQSIIDEELMKMMTRQVPFQNMMVTRAIGSSYKPNSTYPLKIFSDELRKQGHQIQAGDRIDYVFVRCEEPERNEKQGYKMRIPEHYWANVSQEPLDYLHYVEKIAKNAIDQIFYLGYKEIIDKIEEKCKVEKKQRGKIYTHLNNQYIGTWVKLIKKKEELVSFIKYYKPHFPSQEPHFSATWN